MQYGNNSSTTTSYIPNDIWHTIFEYALYPLNNASLRLSIALILVGKNFKEIANNTNYTARDIIKFIITSESKAVRQALPIIQKLNVYHQLQQNALVQDDLETQIASILTTSNINKIQISFIEKVFSQIPNTDQDPIPGYSTSECHVLRDIIGKTHCILVNSDERKDFWLSYHSDEYSIINLSQINLPNIENFSHFLVNAYLRGANFENGKFLTSDFTSKNADLQGANLKNTLILRARLKNANLKNANLTDFNSPRLYDELVNLLARNTRDDELATQIIKRPTINLERANLEGANLKNANLKNANLIDTNMKGCNIKGADFSGATFIRSSLFFTILAIQLDKRHEDMKEQKHCDHLLIAIAVSAIKAINELKSPAAKQELLKKAKKHPIFSKKKSSYIFKPGYLTFKAVQKEFARAISDLKL